MSASASSSSSSSSAAAPKKKARRASSKKSSSKSSSPALRTITLPPALVARVTPPRLELCSISSKKIWEFIAADGALSQTVSQLSRPYHWCANLSYTGTIRIDPAAVEEDTIKKLQKFDRAMKLDARDGYGKEASFRTHPAAAPDGKMHGLTNPLMKQIGAGTLLPSLTDVDVSGCQGFTSAGVRWLLKSDRIVSYTHDRSQHKNSSHNRVTKSVLLELGKAKQLQRISLTLSTKIKAGMLACLNKHPALKSLSITQNGFYEVGLPTGLHKLTHLRYQTNDFTVNAFEPSYFTNLDYPALEELELVAKKKNACMSPRGQLTRATLVFLRKTFATALITVEEGPAAVACDPPHAPFPIYLALDPTRIPTGAFVPQSTDYDAWAFVPAD